MRTIYLDMDGVVADFTAYAKKLLKKDTNASRYPDHEWRKLADNKRLFRDLDKTPEADTLVRACVDICARHKYELLFLTAVPCNNDMHWAFYDKVNWAHDHFPGIPVHFGPFSKDKHVHAKTGDILIDDRTSNITEWRAAGGIGIQHTDIDLTIKALYNSI